MKTQNILTYFSFFLILMLNANCAPHCDDEDYRHDEKKAYTIHTDTLNVSLTD